MQKFRRAFAPILLVGIKPADRKHDWCRPHALRECQIRSHLFSLMQEAHIFDRRIGQLRVLAKRCDAFLEGSLLSGGILCRPAAECEVAKRNEITFARGLAIGLLLFRGARSITLSHPAPRSRPFVAIEAVDLRENIAHVVRLHPRHRVGVAISALLHCFFELWPIALWRQFVPQQYRTSQTAQATQVR